MIVSLEYLPSGRVKEIVPSAVLISILDSFGLTVALKYVFGSFGQIGALKYVLDK